MSSVSANDYAARSAACERCAAHIEVHEAANEHDAIAQAWLARKLRVDAEAWANLAAQVRGSSSREQAAASGKAPTKLGKKMTDRMAESLKEMTRGTEVESEEFFSWPRWRYQRGARITSSLACPTRAMLDGLSERGLVSWTKVERRWITSINDLGRKAMVAHELEQRERKASNFLRFSISYCIEQEGFTRTTARPVVARTETEAIKKLKTQLQRQNSHYEYRDFKVDWKGPQ